MVARCDFLDVAADLFDDAGPFVSEYDRHRYGIELIAGDHVGVAHPGRHDPN